jgi:hypothetical protein
LTQKHSLEMLVIIFRQQHWKGLFGNIHLLCSFCFVI